LRLRRENGQGGTTKDDLNIDSAIFCRFSIISLKLDCSPLVNCC